MNKAIPGRIFPTHVGPEYAGAIVHDSPDEQSDDVPQKHEYPGDRQLPPSASVSPHRGLQLSVPHWSFPEQGAFCFSTQYDTPFTV